MRLLLVVWLVFAACGRKDPAAPPAQRVAVTPEVVAADAAPRARPVGWWRSNELCLELFANGDFQLNITPDGNPKVQAIGSATLTPDGDGWKVELSVTRIFQARFIGKCRRYVSEAKDLDSFDVEQLGVKLVPKTKTTLSLRIGPDAATVCAGERCANLHPETPKLVGRWDVAGEQPMQSAHWTKGDILGIYLGEAGYEYTSILYVGGDGGRMDSINNDDKGKVTYVGPDRFDVELAKRHFTAMRLAGEGLQLCEGDECTILWRRFDRDSTELR